MKTEELKEKLKKSLILEIATISMPIILYMSLFLFSFLVGLLSVLGVSDEVTKSILLTLFAILIIGSITLFIIRNIITIKTMNSCISYLRKEEDKKYRANALTARTAYIISIFLTFIPLINFVVIGILFYNLIIWLYIREKLNSNFQQEYTQEN